MRTEQEMYDLILKTAREDERIRAVYMNGSRTNPNVPKDIFQDYDVVYVVHETESFIEDRDWIERQFGKILYMQLPDEFPDEGTDTSKAYGWLVQLADGNRIDLHVAVLEEALQGGLDDSLCQVLLDKEGIMPVLPEASDKDYRVQKPDAVCFGGTCNEFWWCLNNVAKGLWRNELPYVQDMVNYVVRKQLEKLLSWKIGIQTGWSVSVGKSGKYMYRWLTDGDWKQYLSTWFSCDIREAWEAVLRMCELFDRTAREVAEGLGFTYNVVEAENSLAFLKHVRELPGDAKEVL